MDYLGGVLGVSETEGVNHPILVNPMKENLSKDSFTRLVEKIKGLVNDARQQAVRSVNRILVQTNWEIGRYIVEYEQQGKEKAKYGTQLLDSLSRQLTEELGRGFSLIQIRYMRSFYLTHRI